MVRASATPAVAVAVLAVWFTPAARGAGMDHETRVLPLPAGYTLAVALTVGSVRIVGADRDDAVLEVEREAPSEADMERIPLHVDTRTRDILIRATQLQGATDPRLRTDITLQVPRNGRVASVSVMEGAVTVSGFAGSIQADVRRGDIEAVDVSGTVRFETGIGNVVVRRARLTPGGLLRLRAFNGDVRLSLAERPPNARILALALNGTIESAIPLAIKDTWGPHWGEATLGAGDPVISIDIITGTIHIAVEPAAR